MDVELRGATDVRLRRVTGAQCGLLIQLVGITFQATPEQHEVRHVVVADQINGAAIAAPGGRGGPGVQDWTGTIHTRGPGVGWRSDICGRFRVPRRELPQWPAGLHERAVLRGYRQRLVGAAGELAHRAVSPRAPCRRRGPGESPLTATGRRPAAEDPCGSRRRAAPHRRAAALGRFAPARYVIGICGTGFANGGRLCRAGGRRSEPDGGLERRPLPRRRGPNPSRRFSRAQARRKAALAEPSPSRPDAAFTEYYLDCGEEGYGARTNCFEEDTTSLDACPAPDEGAR